MGMRIEDARLDDADPKSPSVLMVLGRLLEKEAVAMQAGRTLAVEALTDALVVEVLRAGTASNPEWTRKRGSDPRLRRAMELLETRYADALTIDEMARAASMSRYHFTRLFRLETGKTPYRYLLDVRLARAAELLRARRCSVTEAAIEVGWNDLGRFGRMFREVHGVAPRDYLRSRSTRP
jgi:transcriptional regulator GlxA family with amidase domain